ncbi:MAG TPA: cysteine-rich CWC family protein [Pyrinomonadaceae bacterium]|nr:cysteine-rich CWC family protein [Acidobacteriota bacterium]HQZ95509.1 cysteine-rich CWC family protein [Pyrinomonadaceae bacterium]
MTTSEPKICGSCGNSFGCGAKADGCWCVNVSLPPEIADDLKLKYEDCLCPVCLTALETLPSIVVTYPNGATEIIAGAVRADTENYHEGMFDFYDERGTLLKQISMSANIDWKLIGPKNSENTI